MNEAIQKNFEEMKGRYREPVNGVYYHKGTPDAVVSALEWARRNRVRIGLRLGDPETGRDWNEEFEVEGYVGRTCGPLVVPLLVNNSRSSGGGPILTANVLRIVFSTTNGPKVLYEAENYQAPRFTIGPAHETSRAEGYVEGGYINGELHAQFKKPGQAARWVAKMQRLCGLPKEVVTA